MKWADWTYFTNNWEDDPRTADLKRERTAGHITRAEYKAGMQLVKADVLNKMLADGRITKHDVSNPRPPRPAKIEKPYIGKKVSLGKAAPAHGRAHKPKTLFKYASELPGGLPGLGKK